MSLFTMFKIDGTKRVFGIIVATIVIFIIVYTVSNTNFSAKKANLLDEDYQVDQVVYDTTLSLTPETQPYFYITADYSLYMRNQLGDKWDYIGQLESYPLTLDELEHYTLYRDGWISDYHIHKITDAYILRVGDGDNNFYIAFQTKSGDILLAYGWEDINERWQGASDDTSVQWMFKLKSTFS